MVTPKEICGMDDTQLKSLVNQQEDKIEHMMPGAPSNWYLGYIRGLADTMAAGPDGEPSDETMREGLMLKAIMLENMVRAKERGIKWVTNWEKGVIRAAQKARSSAISARDIPRGILARWPLPELDESDKAIYNKADFNDIAAIAVYVHADIMYMDEAEAALNNLKRGPLSDHPDIKGAKFEDDGWIRDIDWGCIYNHKFNDILDEHGIDAGVDKWGAYGWRDASGAHFGDASNFFPFFDDEDALKNFIHMSASTPEQEAVARFKVGGGDQTYSIVYPLDQLTSLIYAGMSIPLEDIKEPEVLDKNLSLEAEEFMGTLLRDIDSTATVQTSTINPLVEEEMGLFKIEGSLADLSKEALARDRFLGTADIQWVKGVGEAILGKARKMATLTPEEDKAWQKAFEFYLEHGADDLEADERTWKDLQLQFPRLKVFEGVEPEVYIVEKFQTGLTESVNVWKGEDLVLWDDVPDALKMLIAEVGVGKHRLTLGKTLPVQARDGDRVFYGVNVADLMAVPGIDLVGAFLLPARETGYQILRGPKIDDMYFFWEMDEGKAEGIDFLLKRKAPGFRSQTLKTFPKYYKKRVSARGGIIYPEREGWIEIASDQPAGGGHFFDLLYNPDTARVKEIKWHKDSPLHTTETTFPLEDFDPNVYGNAGELFINFLKTKLPRHFAEWNGERASPRSHTSGPPGAGPRRGGMALTEQERAERHGGAPPPRGTGLDPSTGGKVTVWPMGAKVMSTKIEEYIDDLGKKYNFVPLFKLDWRPDLGIPKQGAIELRTDGDLYDIIFNPGLSAVPDTFFKEQDKFFEMLKDKGWEPSLYGQGIIHIFPEEGTLPRPSTNGFLFEIEDIVIPTLDPFLLPGAKEVKICKIVERRTRDGIISYTVSCFGDVGVRDFDEQFLVRPPSLFEGTRPISPRDGALSTEGDVMANDAEIRRLKAEIKRLEEKDKYQGWTNRETWATGLWIDNERELYEHARAMVKEIKSGISEDPNVKEGVWTEQEAFKFRLSDRLKEWVADDLREMRAESPTLITVFDEIGSLWRVNWDELAEHYIEAESES